MLRLSRRAKFCLPEICEHPHVTQAKTGLEWATRRLSEEDVGNYR